MSQEEEIPIIDSKDNLTSLNVEKTEGNSNVTLTPFCVENAQMPTLPSLIYAHNVGVLNEKRCKTQNNVDDLNKKNCDDKNDYVIELKTTDKKPIQYSNKASADKKPIQSSNKASADKKSVQSSNKASADKKPVQSSNKASVDKKVVSETATKSTDNKVVAEKSDPKTEDVSQNKESMPSSEQNSKNFSKEPVMKKFTASILNSNKKESNSESCPMHDVEESFVNTFKTEREYVKYLYKHIEKSFENAENGLSKITNEILHMDGMTGKKTRHFYNNLMMRKDTRYLEIGTWKGSSICSAMCGNNAKIICIDNWSEFGDVKEEFLKNFEKYKGINDVKFIEQDCYAIDVSVFPKFNIYLYDGNNEHESHYKALTHYYNCLDNIFIFIVDDWNWQVVRSGTFESFDTLNLSVLYEKEIRTTNDDTHPVWGSPEQDAWHNGIYVSILKKNITNI
jgi:hypothetical protein